MHPLLRRTLEGLLAWCTLLLVAASPLQAQGGKQALRRVQLDSGWEFRQSDPAVATQATGWLPAQVPGDVHLDLIRNKVIPSPFYRDNESKLQWIQEAAWEYRTRLWLMLTSCTTIMWILSSKVWMRLPKFL